jgi:hypothetical protein
MNYAHAYYFEAFRVVGDVSSPGLLGCGGIPVF